MVFESPGDYSYKRPEEASTRLSQETQTDEGFLAKAGRELDVLGRGIASGLVDGVQEVRQHPWRTAGDIAASSGMLLAMRGPGWLKVPAAGIGALGSVGFAAEAIGSVIDVAPALKDTWNSPHNFKANESIIEQKLGPLALNAAAMAVSGYGAARFGRAASIKELQLTIPIASVEGRLSRQSITPEEAALVAGAKKSLVRVEIQTSGGTVQGAGFLVSKEGLVATALHNLSVPDHVRQESFHVYGTNGTRYPVAAILKVDEKNDLALLQIKKKLWQRFTPLALETSGLPKSESPALGLGYPAMRSNSFSAAPGKFLYYFTASESNLNAAGEDSLRSGAKRYAMAIAGAQGMSGGPILNSRGNVIGLINQNAVKVGDPTAFAFAAPSHEIAAMVKQVKVDNAP